MTGCRLRDRRLVIVSKHGKYNSQFCELQKVSSAGRRKVLLKHFAGEAAG